MADTFTDSGRLLKMEVDYSATVDEKIPICEKLAKVIDVKWQINRINCIFILGRKIERSTGHSFNSWKTNSNGILILSLESLLDQLFCFAGCWYPFNKPCFGCNCKALFWG